MGRVDYYYDSDAPTANSLVVDSSAIVVNNEGRVLLQRRSDSGNWALPGGTMEIGETLAQSIIREVKEETGFDVQIARIVGICSDPSRVFAFGDIAGMQMHESIRLRVRDYLENTQPVLR